jgi:hypothetical protein
MVVFVVYFVRFRPRRRAELPELTDTEEWKPTGMTYKETQTQISQLAPAQSLEPKTTMSPVQELPGISPPELARQE